MNLKKYLLLNLLSVLLVACGSESNDDTDQTDLQIDPPTEIEFSPEAAQVSEIRLVDAAGYPLANAMVEISLIDEEPSTEQFLVSGSPVVASATQNASTDQFGNLTVDDLEPGRYTVSVTVGGITVTSSLVINTDNASTGVTLAAPLIDEGDGFASLEGLAIFASISGVIYDDQGPVAGAQIEISAGSETNGAITSDITNENGEYTLIINVSSALDLTSATLRIVKEGYTLLSVNFNPTTSSGFVGENFGLEENDGDMEIIYSENFEQTSDGSICGAWTLQNIESADFQDGIETEFLTNLWHSHDSGLSIKNAALTANYVQLAPDDKSMGLVPDPYDQHACWYGKAVGSDESVGNFLSEPIDFPVDLDGGESVVANGGAIVSPTLDLTAEEGPLALTFKTWWEIESVNPNESGYDLLIIETSIDGGNNWDDLARLNPLSDPNTGDLDRDPIPFTTRGFNRAPEWVQQELIDISHLAGESNVNIRFLFLTYDELFNGFRGWLVDDVQVTRQAGTFPHYDSSFNGSQGSF